MRVHPGPGCACSLTAAWHATQIAELEASIQAKDDLLAKSLHMVTAWEAKFAGLRKAQEPLLFNSSGGAQ